jgi:hypothetical protein
MIVDGTTPTSSILIFRDFFKFVKDYFYVPEYGGNEKWFNEFFERLKECFVKDDSFSEDIYSGYYNMGLPKTKNYISYYDAFELFLSDVGLSDSEWDGDIEHSSRIPYVNAPWESWGYERLEKTDDYFWFLVLLMQRMGSLTEYEYIDLMGGLKALYERGYTEKFDIKWFEPLQNWIIAKRMGDEIANSKISIKSFSLPISIMKGFEPDDVSSIPEYDIDENYLIIDGSFYHRDKVMLAITASGGFAQALERQDLEPKITNVASLLGKRKRRGKK